MTTPRQWNPALNVHDVDISGKLTVMAERPEPVVYAMIPKLVQLTLTPYELALYTNYKQTVGEEPDGECKKSNTTLANETGMSSRQVQRAREGLFQKGYIKVIPRGKDQPPIVHIIDVWARNRQIFMQKPQPNVDAVRKLVGLDSESNPPSEGATDSPTPMTHSPTKNNHRRRTKDSVSTDVDSTAIEDQSTDTPQSEPPKAKRPRKPEPIFDTLAELHWNIQDPAQIDATTAKRINMIKSWLKENSPGATADTLRAFVKWFIETTEGKISPPRDKAKFAERFTEFREHCERQKNKPAPVPMMKITALYSELEGVS